MKKLGCSNAIVESWNSLPGTANPSDALELQKKEKSPTVIEFIIGVAFGLYYTYYGLDKRVRMQCWWLQHKKEIKNMLKHQCFSASLL